MSIFVLSSTVTRSWHDNMIQSLLHHVRKHGDEAKAAGKELVYNAQAATNADLQKAGKVLKL